MRRADQDPVKSLPNVPIVMARHDLEDIGEVPVPAGYRIRTFRPGDEAVWARVENAVGEFRDEARALEQFAGEFGPHVDEMRERCLFLETAEGEVVGTTTAWRNPDFQGQSWGRIHWVAVVPAHQGKGLGRLLVTEALLLTRKWHTRIYLTTQTSSWVAVHLYLTLGFVPFLTAPAEEAGWALLRLEAPHPLLGPPPYAGSVSP
jgi:GNAT superfamily N-acetyltransferase